MDDYYTKEQIDTLKQNKLTAGENITIQGDVISAVGDSAEVIELEYSALPSVTGTSETSASGVYDVASINIIGIAGKSVILMDTLDWSPENSTSKDYLIKINNVPSNGNVRVFLKANNGLVQYMGAAAKVSGHGESVLGFSFPYYDTVDGSSPLGTIVLPVKYSRSGRLHQWIIDSYFAFPSVLSFYAPRPYAVGFWFNYERSSALSDYRYYGSDIYDNSALVVQLNSSFNTLQDEVSRAWNQISTLSRNVKRSDWETTDSTDYSYIENRPFYEEETTTDTRTFSNPWGLSGDSDGSWGADYYVNDFAWAFSDAYSELSTAFADLVQGLEDGDEVIITIEMNGDEMSGIPGIKYALPVGTFHREEDPMMGDIISYVVPTGQESSASDYVLQTQGSAKGGRLYLGFSSDLWNSILTAVGGYYGQLNNIYLGKASRTLKQLDSKFIKIDGSTIKINANGELYVDTNALRTALGS